MGEKEDGPCIATSLGSVMHQAASPIIPHHASEEAYAIFVLKHHGSLSSQNYYLQSILATISRYLTTRRLISRPDYLFERSLQQACEAAELLDGQGKHTIHAHRLRHTVGTELAERGAKLHTIMSVLGHTSVSMTLVYAQISDREVLKDYQAVLGPGATLAGPFAETLKSGELPASSVDWLKSNWFKTELELGSCLCLPQEGPCECDLYLTCAKFVTTPAYAPRLRRHRRIEQELVEGAITRGWRREVKRHQCTIRRIEQLLVGLNEPLDGPKAIE